MPKKSNLVRLLAVVAALVLFASACGDDAGTDAGADPETPSSDTPTDDGDTPPEDDDMPTDDDPPADEPDVDVPAGSFDCAEVQDAFEAAGDMIGGSDAPASPEEEFNQARAALAALATQVPEISDDLNTAIDSLDSLGAVYEQFGWDADFTDNPAQAAAFAQALISEGNILEMSTALSSLGVWVQSNCGVG